MLRTIYIFLLAIGITVIAEGCKKQTSQMPPKRYQPGVDAIAVRPLPTLDNTQAQRILRSGPILATQDISTGEYVEPAAPVMPITPAPAAVGTTPAFIPPAPSPAPSWGGSDPNSY